MSAIDVQNYPYPFFAREGWPFIAISLIVFLALLILDLFFGAFLALILSIFTFQFLGTQNAVGRTMTALLPALRMEG